MNISRRKILKSICLGAATIGSAAAIDAFAVEPDMVVVRTEDIAIKHLPDSFDSVRIAHISDLHCGSAASSEFLFKVVEKMNSLEPDVVILTGDYTTRFDKTDYFDQLVPILSRIRSKFATYACLGNHDYGLTLHTYRSALTLTCDAIESSGAELLKNSAIRLSIKGESVNIVGLGDINRWDCKPSAAFESVDTNKPTIVITHSPDCISRVEDYRYDALLCGHTHGGQVCLPFLGPIIVPSDDGRFRKGRYLYKGRFIYVNSGIATLPARMPGPRFLCPPEITLYTLKRLADS